MRNSINKNLELFKMMTPEQIYNDRKNKFLKIGRNKGFMKNVQDLSLLDKSKDDFVQILKSKKYIIPILGITLILLILLFVSL